MCPHCRAFITTDDKVCPYCDAPVGPRAVDRRNPGEILGGLIPQARFTTVVILLINLGLYLATAVYSMKNSRNGSIMDIDQRTLMLFGGKWSEAIAAGQWWRLITAGFLHGGVIHILMNSWVLYDLGAQVEQVFGTPRMLAIYFVGTVGGFYASYYFSPALSIGASAGICGLLGAMIAFGVQNTSRYGSELRAHYIRWALYIVAMGFLISGIDNYAHVGGGIAGFAVAYLAGTPRVMGAAETVWKIIAGACVATTAVAFYLMVTWMMKILSENG